jgi:hypothetical protein
MQTAIASALDTEIRLLDYVVVGEFVRESFTHHLAGLENVGAARDIEGHSRVLFYEKNRESLVSVERLYGVGDTLNHQGRQSE